MTYIEIDEQQRGLSRTQTINSLVAVLMAVGMMGLGLLMRNSAMSASVPFLDEASGIRAQIPAGWLVTRNTNEFIVQAQDPKAVPFKTVLRVSVLPVGAGAEPRNIVDTLTLQRAAGRLSNYTVLSIEAITLRGEEALELTYAYVQTEPNPFLSSVPLVIQGRDVVVIRGNQALVITYREERARFEENESLYERFLATLQF